MSSRFNAQQSKTKLSHFCFGIISPPSLDPDQEIVSSKTVSFSENRSGDDHSQGNTINLSGTSRGNIPLGSIAMDCGASISVFVNLSLLQRIQKLIHSILVHCGAAKFRNSHMGDLHSSLWHLPLPRTGYYAYPNGVANLLSLAHVSNEYRVYYDSWVEQAFYIFHRDGTYIKFTQQKNGLYLYHIGEDKEESFHVGATVKEEQGKYSHLDNRKATLARRIQEKLCLPSDVDLGNAIDSGCLPDCGITKRSIRIATNIYGKSNFAIEGKSMQRKQKTFDEEFCEEIPEHLIREYGEVTLFVDIMHVNGLAFLVSTAKHLGFIQCICIRTAHEERIINTIKNFANVYQLKGFKVTTVHGDGQFRCCKEELIKEPYSINVIICAKDAHVEVAERTNRLLKERIRCVKAMLPYNKYPRRLLMEMVYTIVQMINAVPRKGSISYGKLSIREIITGKKLIIPPVAVGWYVHAIPGGSSNPTYNSTDKKRSFEAVYLRSDQGGGHNVFSLKTKQVCNVGRVIESPMPQSAIDNIENMAEREGVPDGITFGDSNNYQVLDDFEFPDEKEIDSENDDDAASDASYGTEDSDELPSDSKLPRSYENIEESELESLNRSANEDEESIDENVGVEANAQPGVDEDDEAGVDDDGFNNPVEVVPVPAEKVSESESDDEDESDNHKYKSDNDNEEEESNDDHENDPDESENENNNQTRRPRMLKEIEDHLQEGRYWALAVATVSEFNKMEASLDTPQFGYNKGLKLFGKEAYEATVKELSDNLLDRGAVEMVLNPSKRIYQMSMLYLMFIKRKRTGLIKSRGCCDGRSQREYITKDESSSPTVATNALFAVCVLIAAQGRKTVVVDIPGAFLQSDYPSDKEGYIRFTGTMVDMILKIKPEYRRFVVKTRSGSKYLIGKLLKGVYGTLLGAILFYKKLKDYLEKLEFKMNPYDLCTFNKMINGQQCTIQFHVDDLFISHRDTEVLEEITTLLNDEFGKHKKLEPEFGPKLDYLGMQVDFSQSGTVKFTMFDYLEDILVECESKGWTREAVTPAIRRTYSKLREMQRN